MRPLVLALLVLVAALAAALVVPAALAGPPCVCWQLDIGDAKSLPWGGAPMEPDPAYDRARLVDDTMKLLEGDGGAAPPTLVRMETLRRATVYAKDAPDRGAPLLLRLQARALDAAATDDAAASRTWFDAGYAVACFAQYDQPVAGNGYAWTEKARSLAPADAAMDLGGALQRIMRKGGRDAVFQAHVDRVLAREAQEPLVARNLRKHMPWALEKAEGGPK
jgi:hypothetical protein